MSPRNLKGSCPRSPLVYRMHRVLSPGGQGVPMGTNLGIFSLLWLLRSGRLLRSRGAALPGLAARGLTAAAVRRAWAALASGKWPPAPWLAAWAQRVREAQPLHAPQAGGYRPGACALVGFFRPRRQDGATKPASATAGQAFPAMPLGRAARVGTGGPQRLAGPCLRVRGAPAETSATDCQMRLLQRATAPRAADAALGGARGFPLRQLQAAGRQRSVVRAPGPWTARRVTLPPSQGQGRTPGRGALVRPLPRTDQGRTRAATPRPAPQPGGAVWGHPPWRCPRCFGTPG